MGQYKKLIVCVIGVVAMTLGVPVAGVEAAAAEVLQAVIGLATAFGVYQVKNDA